MRLQSSVLLCYVCLLSAQGDEDWIDPYDMENYDAGSQTMRKPIEEIKPAAESIPDPPKSSNWKNLLESPVLQLSVALAVVFLSISWLARRRGQIATAADPQGGDGHGNVAGGDVMEQRRVDDAVLQDNQPEGPRGVGENNGDDPQADTPLGDLKEPTQETNPFC